MAVSWISERWRGDGMELAYVIGASLLYKRLFIPALLALLLILPISVGEAEGAAGMVAQLFALAWFYAFFGPIIKYILVKYIKIRKSFFAHALVFSNCLILFQTCR